VFLTFGRAARELQNDVEVIVLRHLVFLLKTARDTAMENGVFSALELHTHGFHKSLTRRLAIARIHVNMLTPKATRTMVSVTTSIHDKIALFASEIFLGTLEFLCHHGFRLLSFFVFGCQRSITLLLLHHSMAMMSI